MNNRSIIGKVEDGWDMGDNGMKSRLVTDKESDNRVMIISIFWKMWNQSISLWKSQRNCPYDRTHSFLNALGAEW